MTYSKVSVAQPAFEELVRKLDRDETQQLSLSGLTATAKAIYLVLLWQAVERPLLVIVDGAKQAEILEELIGTFFDLLASGRDAQRPQTIPALDVLPHQNLSPHSEISEQRAIGLWRLSTREVPITITPIQSALLRTENRDFYRQLALTLRVGEEELSSKMSSRTCEASVTRNAIRWRWSASIRCAAAFSMSFLPRRRSPFASSSSAI